MTFLYPRRSLLNARGLANRTSISMSDLLRGEHLIRGVAPYQTTITAFESEGPSVRQHLENKVPGVLYAVTLRNPLTWELSRYGECRVGAARRRKEREVANEATRVAGIAASVKSESLRMKELEVQRKQHSCESWDKWEAGADTHEHEAFVRGLFHGVRKVSRRHVHPEELAQAKRMLERYDAILILEDHPFDLEIMRRLAGWQHTSITSSSCVRCRQNVVLGAGADSPPRVLSVDEYFARHAAWLTPEQIEKIKRRHVLDLDLYQHGVELSRAQRNGSFWARPPLMQKLVSLV